MPSNKTKNYSLNQWSKDDRVLMEDFNADNAKIDAALGEKLNKMNVIWVAKPDSEAFTHAGFSSVPDWMKNCEYYAMTFEFPFRAEDVGKTFEFYVHGYKEQKITIPAQPFILLFFPHYDLSQPLRFLLLCETPRYFVYESSYGESYSFFLQVNNDQSIPGITQRYLGWK